MNLTSQQKDLLLAIVDAHHSGDGAPFIFVHHNSGSGLCYPGGIEVRLNADELDFRQLEREKLITFRRVSVDVLRGKPTALGIEAAASLRDVARSEGLIRSAERGREGATRRAMANAEFWKRLEEEFHQHAVDDPDLTAYWGARFGRWQLRSGGPLPGVKAHARALRRFKKTASEGANELTAFRSDDIEEAWQRTYVTDATEPWELWLNRMTKPEYNCRPLGAQIAVSKLEWERIEESGKSLSAVRSGFSNLDCENRQNEQESEEARSDVQNAYTPALDAGIVWIQDAEINHVFKEAARLCADIGLGVESVGGVPQSREVRPGASLQDPAFWRALRKEFDDLAVRQRSILGHPPHDKWLRAYCDFSEEHGEFGCCRREGGLDGRLISDFEEVATRAACASVCAPTVEPVRFWLYCLAQDLLKSSEPEIRTELSPRWASGGFIQGLLESSAGYCSRLAAMAERQTSGSLLQRDARPSGAAGNPVGQSERESPPQIAPALPESLDGAWPELAATGDAVPPGMAVNEPRRGEAIPAFELKTAKRRGRHRNQARRDAIRAAIGQYGEAWRDHLSSSVFPFLLHTTSRPFRSRWRGRLAFQPSLP
jgi:hypothetical protein